MIKREQKNACPPLPETRRARGGKGSQLICRSTLGGETQWSMTAITAANGPFKNQMFRDMTSGNKLPSTIEYRKKYWRVNFVKSVIRILPFFRKYTQGNIFTLLNPSYMESYRIV